MVVDFSAKWCGPCRMIEPAIHDMGSKFTDVDFVKIDVDELPVSNPTPFAHIIKFLNS